MSSEEQKLQAGCGAVIVLFLFGMWCLALIPAFLHHWIWGAVATLFCWPVILIFYASCRDTWREFGEKS